MILKLRKVHIDYILKQSRFPANFRKRVYESFCITKGKSPTVSVSEDELNLLRKIVAGLLQEVGFDREYKPTDAGKLLEDLVDLFYSE